MKELKWSEIKKPSDKIGSRRDNHGYDHVTVETVLGTIVIDWKSWKDNPSYDYYLIDNFNMFHGTEYSLDDAKDAVKENLKKFVTELAESIGLQMIDDRVVNLGGDIVEMDDTWNEIERETVLQNKTIILTNGIVVWLTINGDMSGATHWKPSTITNLKQYNLIAN